MKKNLKKLQNLVVKNFFVKPEQVNLYTSFQKDLRLSESEFMAMIAYTENAFKMEMTDKEIIELKTIKDVIRCIKQHTEKVSLEEKVSF